MRQAIHWSIYASLCLNEQKPYVKKNSSTMQITKCVPNEMESSQISAEYQSILSVRCWGDNKIAIGLKSTLNLWSQMW